jgi:hypothetical protein
VSPSTTIRRVTLDVTDEQVVLLGEMADSVVESFAYPRGTPDRKQPTEWHEGRKLQALHDALRRAWKAGT